MNLRQHKRFRSAQQLNWLAFVDRMGRIAYDNSMADFWAEVERKQALRQLIESVPEYQCVKVNGGEVVDTFQSRGDALELVLKHARQKKAKLQVVNTVTGEIEVFSELETA